MEQVDLDQLGKLLGTLYEAGFDSMKWQAFCDGLGEILDGGAKVMLQGHDIRTRSNLGTLTANYDPDHAMAYQAYYSGINLWLPKLKTIPVGNIITDADILAHDSLIVSEFWDGWLRPMGDVSAGTGSVVFREKDRFLFFTSNYSWERQDKYRAKTAAVWRFLTPHVQRAFELQRLLQGQNLVHQRYREALDNVSNPVVLLDRNGRVSHLNSSAETLLRASRALSVDRDNFLHCLDPRADQKIVRSIGNIVSGEATEAVQAAIVVKQGDQPPLIVTITPFSLDHDRTKIFSDFSTARLPVAMLTIVGATRPPHTLQSVLATIYGLTPAEVRLAECLLDGRTLAEHAASYGVSISTVRNQLRSVLDKTDTHRQGEFIALMHRLTP